MATNKHATIRYQALDKCFSNVGRRYSIDDLIDACNTAIFEFTGNDEGVKRRQVYNDIVFMESEQGWSIPLERIKDGRKVYFRYQDANFSINNQPLNDAEIGQLRETILLLNRFKGMPQFEWMEELLSKLEDKFHLKGSTQSYIGFEHNPYLFGLSHLSVLFNGIVYKQVLNIGYKGYDKPLVKWSVHPYYIKQYNSRWFLFGYNEQYGGITNLPLDRIESIEVIEHKYRENNDVDFEEYFDDVIGVTIPIGEEITSILLRFSSQRLPYVLSKPLHHSQKLKDRNAGLIEISVIPNKELEALILSFGSAVEVLSPDHVRDSITKQISDLYKNYSSVHADCTIK